MKAPLLLADVGGTNVRFGFSLRGGEVRYIRSFGASEHPDFIDALRHYLKGAAGEFRNEAELAGIRIAAAGPVEHAAVQLTNSPWRISAAAVEAAAGAPVRLYNDLEAVALLLPHVGDTDVVAIGEDWHIGAPATRIAVNVGTGFGAATAYWQRHDARWAVTASEAGHMSCCLGEPEAALIGMPLKCVEDLLSGVALGEIYARIGHSAAAMPTGSAVEAFSNRTSDNAARELAHTFARVLGTIAGDLVLAHAAWGGVFLCGSVVRGWLSGADDLEVSLFRQAFADKGKMRERVARVPTFLLDVEEPALRGMSYAS